MNVEMTSLDFWNAFSLPAAYDEGLSRFFVQVLFDTQDQW
jgi:hypothetical protein